MNAYFHFNVVRFFRIFRAGHHHSVDDWLESDLPMQDALPEVGDCKHVHVGFSSVQLLY